MKRRRSQLCAAYLIVLFGLVLIAIAFFVPPRGYIDPTVLTAFGEMLTFAGSLIGIDYHYRYRAASRSSAQADSDPPDV